MKKRFLVTITALAFSMSVLSGCGVTAEDYEDDYETLNKVSEDMQELDSTVDGAEEFIDMVDDMDMKTKEGKTLKKDLEKFSSKYYDFTEALEDDDTDTMTEITESIESLYDDLEEHEEAFHDAAEEAGVDVDSWE